jgi:histidyl-tRNA synthetase
VPAVGFSLGIDRVILALGESAAPAPADVFVVVADPERRHDAELVLNELRHSGLGANAVAGRASVKAQFKAADRQGVRWAVIVGDEMSEGKVVVRAMTDGTQELVERSELVAWLAQ